MSKRSFHGWNKAGYTAALCSLTTLLSAQTQIPPDELSLRAAPYSPLTAMAIRTQAELVEVPVVVRDAKGTVVRDLKRGDFEVFDSGKRKEITTFSVETFSRNATAEGRGGMVAVASAGTREAKSVPPRRYIALVLDDLNTDALSLTRAKTAAVKFVSEALAPNDLVGIFTTALPQNVVFAASVDELRKAIEAVKPHPRYFEDYQLCPVILTYEAYMIDNHLSNEILETKAKAFEGCSGLKDLMAAERAVEALSRTIWDRARVNTENTLSSITAIMAAMGKLPGQRMVLLTSAGFLTGNSEKQVEEITNAALHSGVIINSLDVRGLQVVIPGGDASRLGPKGMAELRIWGRVLEAPTDGMAQLAYGTGGQYFHNNNNLESGLRRLGEAPEIIYLLGFSASGVIRDGKYHALKVRLTGGQQDSVQSRMGYNAPSKDAPTDLTLRMDRDRLLMGTDSPADVAARVTAESDSSDTGPKVVVRAWIDASHLNFGAKQGRHVQHLTVIGALLDVGGNFVVGRQVEANLALKDATLEALAPVGLTVSLSLHAAPGTYNLRVLVQEGLTGKVTTVSRSIQLN